MTHSSYCTTCDDYGHAAQDHPLYDEAVKDHERRVRENDPYPNPTSWSQFRRLYAVGGDDWWVDENAPPNGIGPVCRYCGHLIDYGPTDHKKTCRVRVYMRWEDDES